MEIQKKSYSRNPWRLVDNKGREIEVVRKFEHPTLGYTAIYQAISGETKKECLEKALDLLGRLWDESMLRSSVCSRCESSVTITERK